MKIFIVILTTLLIFFPIIYFYIWHKQKIKQHKEQGDISKCPYLNGTLDKE